MFRCTWTRLAFGVGHLLNTLFLTAVALTLSPATALANKILVSILALLWAVVSYGFFRRRLWGLVLVLVEYALLGVGAVLYQLLGLRQLQVQDVLTLLIVSVVIVQLYRELRRSHQQVSPTADDNQTSAGDEPGGAEAVVDRGRAATRSR